MYNNDKRDNLRNFREAIKGKKAVLFGLARSNMAALHFLLKNGAVVEGRDSRIPDPAIVRELEENGVPCIFGENWLQDVSCDYAFRSPGIRPDLILPHIGNAALTGEIELACHLFPGHLIAVTGSDGKTTTTTVIYEMLKRESEEKEFRVLVGGNIGTPALDRIEDMTENDFLVLELSSFQLMTMSFSPDVAVITNITPNHLNWHTSMDEYASSKKNIFRNQKPDGVTVVNLDDSYADEIIRESGAVKRTFSVSDKADAHLEKNWLILENNKFIQTNKIRIPGLHNVRNYMAAFLAVKDYVSPENMKIVAMTFPGVRHRIEEVLSADGVRYINSSIDTTPTRTIAALSCFGRNVHLILGGYDKHLDMTPLIVPVKEKAKSVVCTGDTGRALMKMLNENGYDGAIVYEEDFDKAVTAAAKNASAGDVVLLSPACASFDHFRNFEERGDRFREIILKLTKLNMERN